MTAKKSKAGSRNRSRLPKSPARKLQRPKTPTVPVAVIDEVEFRYRWRHSVDDPCAIFMVDILHAGLRKKHVFKLDIPRLEAPIRASVWAILGRHGEGVDGPFERSLTVYWLLDLSLQQQSPTMSPAERQAAIAEILTIPVKSDALRIIGVSPLLIWIKPRRRKWLAQRHHINVASLEQDSAQLYLGLQQFEQPLPEADFKVKAEAYTEKLIAHHQRVSQVGQLLRGRLGTALVIQTKLCIESLQNQTL